MKSTERNSKRFTGLAIALAWPHTYCKQVGEWYDGIASWLRISKGRFYKVGHAACILISYETGDCKYFDFGRYHSPYKYGRVRSAETDMELMIKTKAQFDHNTKLQNLHEILWEIQQNDACHGDGILYAAYGDVTIDKCFSKIKAYQEKKHISYGPFLVGQLNCSRFVNKVIKSGRPKHYNLYKLKYIKPFTPTPMNNVNALENKVKLEASRIGSTPSAMHIPLNQTLPPPPKPKNVSKQAQWLSGEGAGSWFDLHIKQNGIYMKRYSAQGIKECDGFFKAPRFLKMKDLRKFRITYPSNCMELTLVIDDQKITFIRSSNLKIVS